MQRSRVETELPEDVRDELNDRLVASGFSGYKDLAEWLAAKGYDISKSSLHRYGSRFEEKLEAIRVATTETKEILKYFDDERGNIPEAALNLIQFEIYKAASAGNMDPEQLAYISRSLASTVQANVKLKKYQEELARKAAEVADKAEKMCQQGGLSVEAADAIKKQILGIAA